MRKINSSLISALLIAVAVTGHAHATVGLPPPPQPLALGTYTTPANSVTSVDTLGNISIKPGPSASYSGIVNGPAPQNCSNTPSTAPSSDFQFTLAGMSEVNPVRIVIAGVGGSGGTWDTNCFGTVGWEPVLQGNILYAGLLGNDQTSFTITLTYADNQTDTITVPRATTASANCTKITTPGPVIVDSNLNKWSFDSFMHTLENGVIFDNSGGSLQSMVYAGGSIAVSYNGSWWYSTPAGTNWSATSTTAPACP